MRSHNTQDATPSGFPRLRFGLVPVRSPLLGESLLLSFPRGTEMFQFPRFPLPALCVQTGVTPLDGCRVSPFGYPRVNAQSAAHRGFSQPLTSFIGSRRQGIHHWPFIAWNSLHSTHLLTIENLMLVLALQFSRSAPITPSRGCSAPSKRNRGRYYRYSNWVS